MEASSKSKTVCDHDSTQEASVTFALIKFGESQYLSGSTGYDARLTVGSEPDLFQVTRFESGIVALKSLRSGGFVSYEPQTGVSVTGAEIGPSQKFELEEPGSGKVAFKSPDGRYLSAGADTDGSVEVSGTTIGPNELFALDVQEGLRLADGKALSHCCGPHVVASDEDSASLVWDDQSHKEMVHAAIHLLRTMSNPTREAKEFVAIWDSRGSFRDRLFQGLRNADYENPWKGNGFYQDHFYDPERGLNYMNQPSSALSEGRRWFNLSLHGGMRAFKLGNGATDALYSGIGYHLGLSLHFFTDLTQPMHTANFTNVFGQNWPLPNLGDMPTQSGNRSMSITISGIG